MILFLAMAATASQSDDYSATDEMRKAGQQYRTCLEKSVIELDDGQESTDGLISAAKAACKDDRALTAGYAAIYYKNLHPDSSVQEGFKFGGAITDKLEADWKPDLALEVLRNRADKRDHNAQNH